MDNGIWLLISASFYYEEQPQFQSSNLPSEFFYIFFKFIYLFWESVHAHVHMTREGAGGGGCRKRESPTGSTLSAQTLTQELMNCEIMTWLKIKSQLLNQLSHLGAPSYVLFLWLVIQIKYIIQYHRDRATKFIILHISPRTFSYSVPAII